MPNLSNLVGHFDESIEEKKFINENQTYPKLLYFSPIYILN